MTKNWANMLDENELTQSGYDNVKNRLSLTNGSSSFLKSMLLRQNRGQSTRAGDKTFYKWTIIALLETYTANSNCCDFGLHSLNVTSLSKR